MSQRTTLDRRQFGAGILGLSFAGLGAGQARAQSGPFNVFTHRVMHTVQWTTFDTGPLQERLFREASLGETSVDVGFVVNTQVVPRAATLFEPLDDYLKKDPVEDIADIFPGLMEGMKVGGKQLAIPFRHASSGLHYNEEILAEKGFSKPPATIEEMIEIAKACSYRRADGTQVVGLCTPGVTYPNVIDLARAWDGDFITPDFKCVADQPPMLNAVRTLPPADVWMMLGAKRVQFWVRSGRVSSVESAPRSATVEASTTPTPVPWATV